MKKNLYQKLRETQNKYCEGKGGILKSDVTAVKKEYVKDAISKGKPEKEAHTIAENITSSCGISGHKKKPKRKVSGTKKPKTKRKVSGTKSKTRKKSK
jgi:hypothetical protein